MKRFANEFTPQIETAISKTKQAILQKVLKESNTYEEAYNKLHQMRSYYGMVNDTYPYLIRELMNRIFDQLLEQITHKALTNQIGQE
ncbi:hypothetical protein FC35_GL000796 [Limosilactobacillus coleohominis DSM 14060]|nr:hypothetical protein FC35_GL000796 [Limosilactobacillus coleohominis DSM 14060]